MGSEVKVLVGEVDGEEFYTPTERILLAKDCKFAAVGFNSTDSEEAIKEAKSVSISLPRYSIPLIWNGGMSNGDWVTYSNLTPDARVVIPFDCILQEITWSNSSSNRSFDIEFYKNGRNTTKYHTEEVRNSSNEYGAFPDLNHSFDAGDIIDLKYVDQGLNASDFVLVLFFQAVES